MYKELKRIYYTMLDERLQRISGGEEFFVIEVNIDKSFLLDVHWSYTLYVFKLECSDIDF